MIRMNRWVCLGLFTVTMSTAGFAIDADVPTFLPAASSPLTGAPVVYSPFMGPAYETNVTYLASTDPWPAGYLGLTPGTLLSTSVYLVGGDHRFATFDPQGTFSKGSLLNRLWGLVRNHDADSSYLSLYNFSQTYGYLFMPIEQEYLADSKSATPQLVPGMSLAAFGGANAALEAAGVTNFRTWYAAQTFSDAYGLITPKVSPLVTQMRDYTLKVLTSPTKFSFAKLDELSGSLLSANSMTDLPKLTSINSSLTAVALDISNSTLVDVYLGSRIKNYDALVKQGVISSTYEGDLFNMWFALDYVLSDVFPLLRYAESGQSALSIPQVAIDTILPAALAKRTILDSKTRSTRAKESTPANEGVSEAVQVRSNSPLSDYSFTMMDILGREATIHKTSGGYSYLIPNGDLEFAAYYSLFYSQFPHLGRDYTTVDTFFKGNWNFQRDGRLSSSAFTTAGVTLNDGSLWANYINGSLGASQNLTLGDWGLNYGALVSGRYWSQFPQTEVKLTSALRLSYDLFQVINISLDSIYSRSLGTVYQGTWSGYEGTNLNDLTEGLSLDLHVGDLFSLNAGVNANLLMEDVSTVEVYLGGMFVF